MTYPSDLTSAQWELLEPLLPPQKQGGRPRSVDLRAVCNGIFYHLKTGCQWRMLPKDFPLRQNEGKQGEVYGFDGGKKVKGRKRHIIVDSLGQVMKVLVTEANGSERVGAMYGLMEWTERYPAAMGRLNTVLADAGYRGEKFSGWVYSLVGAKVEIVANQTQEFAVIAKRWVVERTFAWFNLYHRLSKDYELVPEVSESAILWYYGVMVHLTLCRLAPP